jgi:hypothetical protein
MAGINSITDLTTSGLIEVFKIHGIEDAVASPSGYWKPARARK